MTREEAINNLNMISVAFVEPVTKEQRRLIDDTFDMAIKALEQQPNRCDSCVHSEEQDGSNCYECVKGITDNFELMRDATEEERKSVKDYVESISKPTGFNFYKVQPTDGDCISRTRLLEHLENITMDTNPDHYEDKDKWYQANGFNLCKVGIEIYVKNLPSVTPSYNSVKTELEPCEDWKFYYKHGYTQAKRDLLCDDCISRAKALEMLGDVPENWTDTEKEIQEVNDYRWFKSILEELPSVTPRQRVGRWILEEVKDEDGRPYDIKYFCSECQAERPPIWDDYCGACGAKMEVEE